MKTKISACLTEGAEALALMSVMPRSEEMEEPPAGMENSSCPLEGMAVGRRGRQHPASAEDPGLQLFGWT